MGAALQQIVDAALPYVLAAIPILGAAALAYLRRSLQVEAAVESATEVELEAVGHGAVKKLAAKLKTIDRLPKLARPMTAKGLDKLVESAVPAARKRAAESRSRPPEEG